MSHEVTNVFHERRGVKYSTPDMQPSLVCPIEPPKVFVPIHSPIRADYCMSPLALNLVSAPYTVIPSQLFQTVPIIQDSPIIIKAKKHKLR